MGSFKGTMFHTAEWDHDHDLTGERVAVIGTGASAVQVVPQIAERVGQLHVFQRTAPWILPHSDRPTTRIERRLYKTFPFLQKAVRSGVYWSRESFLLGFIKNPKIMGGAEKIAGAHMRKQVKDPALRAKLTPKFRLGCKRVLISNSWYPTLTRENVELVTDGIDAIRGNTIHLADGSTREVDTIILGTGFHVTDPPSAQLVRGRDGGTLADRMQAGIQAYLGATVEGLPNYFKLIGPNTGLGHNSMVYMIESQLNYVMDALRIMDEQGIAEFEVRPDVDGLLQRADPVQAAGHGVDVGLRELVPRRRRQEHDDLAGLHVALPPPHEALQDGGLHAASRGADVPAPKAVA